METSAASALLYRWSKPRGKVRRRVLDLRIPSSCYDFMTSRPALDLSHNESARLAVDSLLSRGLQGYREVLSAEGEVDFLSELEKTYILENGRDGNAGSDPDADSDYGDKEFESVFAGSQSATGGPAVSTDSDLTLAGLDLSSRNDVQLTDPVVDESNVEVYVQSDTRSAVMKDLVREFIRKAGMALAIVMTSFSDVELLCDLLEASRKRNVSVHLLLDHLNLNLFVSMWQDLKLDSKSFPKLSVRSVDGQTYCAKSGRKLTGHITESFIITDWTEVLTGSYSFSWLSWQVHRSLAVLVKGSAILPFHEEFLRLYSSSKPVPSFITFITVPHTLPLHATLHAAENGNAGASKSRLSKTTCHTVWNQDAQNNQTKAKNPGLTNPQSYPDARPLRRAGTGTQTHEEPLQRPPEALVQPVGKTKQPVGAVLAQRHVETLEESHSNPLRPTHASHVQSQLSGRAIDATSEKNARAHESTPQSAASPAEGRHRMVGYQSTLKANLERHSVGTEGLFFWQRNGNRLTEPLGIAAGLDARRQQWTGSFQFKPKVGFGSDYPKELPDSTSPQKQTMTGLWFPLSPRRGPASGLQTHVSSLGARLQNQLQRRHHCSSQQANPTPEALGSKSTSSAMGAFLKPKLQSNCRLFRPGAGATPQPHSSQQGRPPPGLNWMAEKRTERPRPVARQSSLSATYRTGQKTDLRPFYGRTNLTLGRSKSMTDRPSAGLN